MVAGRVPRLDRALEAREAAREEGRAAQARLPLDVGKLVRRGPREALGERPLRRAQHMHGEVRRRVEGRPRPRLLADAPQQQRRVERDGGEGVRRHPLRLATGAARGHDRHAGREAPEGGAQHARLDLARHARLGRGAAGPRQIIASRGGDQRA